MLRWPDKRLAGLMTFENGVPMTGRQVRDSLKIAKLSGWKVIPVGDKCEGFSYETGCPGHPTPEAAP
jgi:hypothetical protein